MPQIAAIAAALIALQHYEIQHVTEAQEADLPAGATHVPFENLEGLILLEASLHGGGRDTTGLLALDTGAGFLTLDQRVAHRLRVTHDATPPRSGIALAEGALARMGLGSLTIDHLTPVLTIDATLVHRVTDRAVLGLLGQRPFTGRAVIVDYAAGRLTVLPVPQLGERSLEASRRVLGAHFGESARVVPFELAGDGKVLVRGRLAESDTGRAERELTWIVDTGATRCALFEPAFADGAFLSRWRAMEGLSAPTLFGDERARVALAPRLSLRAADGEIVEDSVEAVIIGGPLARSLEVVVGEPVHGLIGYSFLGRYRVGIDYVNAALWLEPLPAGWEGRPHRDSQVGVQLERREGAITVAGVVIGSPAHDAQIRVGDRLVSLGGTPSRQLDVPLAIRRLEGRPGTSITLTLERDGRLLTHKLLRRRLL